jgi:hypothetical protein
LTVLAQAHSVAQEDTLKLRLGVAPIDPAPALPQSCSAREKNVLVHLIEFPIELA